MLASKLTSSNAFLNTVYGAKINMNSSGRTNPQPFLIYLLVLLLVSSFSSGSLHAQSPPPITPSGLNTEVSGPINLPSGETQYNITGGTRPENGPNLFQSFGEFGVPENNIANFLNDSGLPTESILGRVTGGNPSNVFGTIQTEGFPGANLFLMNPAGWVFGPNAALNVEGSINFTTADYLRQSDGNIFMALSPDQDSQLSIAPVAAFGFLDGQPGTITVQGSNLTVDQGQSISLVSGDIVIESGLNPIEGEPPVASNINASGGEVLLASVASAGEILVNSLDEAPNINGQTFDALGTITVSQKSTLNSSGDYGGTVRIRGGNFVIDDSTVSANTTGPAEGPLVGQPGEGVDIQVRQDVVIQDGAKLETNVAATVAPGIGSGGVRIKADQIKILETQDVSGFPSTGIESFVEQGSPGGPSGDVVLEANAIVIRGVGNPGIFTDTFFGAGAAGNITLRATGDIEIFDGIIGSRSLLGGGSGNIVLSSEQGNISLVGNTDVFSQALALPGFPSGTSGEITVDAPKGNVFITEGSGISTRIQGGNVEGAGGINVTAHNLFLDEGSIQTDNFQPQVPGGVTINVTGSMSLINNSDIQTTTRGPARSSDLNITASDLLISNGSFVSTETTGSGDAGTLNIFADNLQLTEGGQIRSSSTIDPRIPPGQQSPVIPSGSGGTITIQGLERPANSVKIEDVGSAILTDTEGTGNAGNISILAENLKVIDGAQITSRSSIAEIPGQPPFIPTGSGGTINIGNESPATSVKIADNGSGIFTDTEGTGNAGRIIVNAVDLIMEAGAEISSGSFLEAKDAGDGGTIEINAANSITLSASLINTSAIEGEGGDIQITAGQNVELMNDSTVLAESSGAGDSGSVTLEAQEGSFSSDNSTVSTMAEDAKGGDISISAGQDVVLNNNTNVSAESSGPDDAGDVTVASGNDITMTSSVISTEAAEASGGNIKLNAPNIMLLTDSQITSSVQGTQGTQGGNISLDPIFIILQNTQILARAVEGDGGNITLVASGAIFVDAQSQIDASSELGVDGEVNLQAPIVALAEVVAPLPKNFFVPKSLFADACAAQAGGQFSSFTQGAPAAVPPPPGSFLPSPLMLNMPTAPSSSGNRIPVSPLVQSHLGLDVSLDFLPLNLLPTPGCAETPLNFSLLKGESEFRNM